MAHFILEYSKNLSANEIKLDELLKNLHDAAVGTGLFPLAGIRSRAHACDDYRVADGDPGFAFVHLEVRLGRGRSDEEKQTAADAIFNALSQSLDEAYQQRGLAISFEMNELPETLKFNQNNLRGYLAEKQS
ncbi:5-carboxymethyl-2-hydroxymuconate Delta-isomerase [Pseudoteredinibacter isoporae]|uniref:5-carboxymethyl-2-hydroxymuconate isomerase n=1 Tax=Pseudoteredinibacter isoporae TaxID=570281 RepID=A0A7X0JVJ7_9GAMM|nr:5-carboxymethyl-2-hydroxymuconate Delta-isomerase [Pseudoteredinibacter isoporae]MBB6523055.1 5-carboxymethyl-2-hydroxymuconate isomerase [Pseudoteredinibacter isoporae]NHO88575.1 5-carboxymethyl-2-hydroxymuconate Delta-isomerase [Pseudoteredinibacter isoporae]NIB22734.1 5-carboxymethyl-2-hydroxymuconate Delta-isomerase [Pseudoteredinibacter isoporae]